MGPYSKHRLYSTATAAHLSWAQGPYRAELACSCGDETISLTKALYCLQSSIELGEDFTPTCMAHPDTYLNKLVIGSEEGKIQLWNFASGKMLYEFSGFGDGAVKCIIPSHALDVVGVGMSSGYVHTHTLSAKLTSGCYNVGTKQQFMHTSSLLLSFGGCAHVRQECFSCKSVYGSSHTTQCARVQAQGRLQTTVDHECC